MNKNKSITILLIFFFCISNVFIATVVSQGFSLAVENTLKKDQEVTLIVGTNEDAVKTGVEAFISSLNNDVEINKQNTVISSDSNEIMVIFSHGSEQGMILEGELISWYDLSIIILQSKAKYVFLATCYGANIYTFIEITTKMVLGFNGMVDAFTMGYYFALHVNILFDHFDNAQFNAELLSSRASLIREHPEKIVPLYCTKCVTEDVWWWIFPLQIKTVFHIKLTDAELDIYDWVGLVIAILSLWLGGVAGWVVGVLTIYLEAVILVSQQAHPNGGAWISLGAQILPLLGVWLCARGPSGNVILPIPVTPGDPISTTALHIALRASLHGWTC